MAWEAQFGDFVNGAQIIIDQFLAAAEVKWGQTSGLVLLLPHGYEGQGAEHSSARMERFLDLCAEDNIQVANVTTAAQLFHLLRRQVLRSVRKPLVLFTPKRYLRGREAYSPAEEFAGGHFREVLDDPRSSATRRRAPGRPGHRQDGPRRHGRPGQGRARDDVAVVRVEQLYPWPADQIAATWPATSGPRRSSGSRRSRRTWAPGASSGTGCTPARRRLPARAGSARVASGSPATGSHAMHELEQEDSLARALGQR